MAVAMTKQEILDEILKAARKLDKLDLQILLTKLRVKKLRKDGVKPVAKPRKGVKTPTMEDIDLWKHESRRLNAD
jgi:hypothetical protein